MNFLRLITKKEKYKVKDVNGNDYFTDISPDKRDFKNQPRYANGKPKVRIQIWLEIDQRKLNNSHRAIYGFKIGDKIKKGNIIYKGKEYTLEMKEQVEQAAKEFAKAVS